MFFPQTAVQWHAVWNDFPSLLFLVAFVFEVAYLITKRASLQTVAVWSLAVGAAGAVIALATGLRAAGTIDHGGSMHLVMARHQTLAVGITALFVALAGWRVWRRHAMGPTESRLFVSAAALGVVGLLWTAHLGGVIVYEYGGGIPTEVLEGALQERQRGHTHNAGAETEDTVGEVTDRTDETAHQHD